MLKVFSSFPNNLNRPTLISSHLPSLEGLDLFILTSLSASNLPPDFPTYPLTVSEKSTLPEITFCPLP